MSEQDQMDQLLSKALSAPVPELSADFDRQLARRLQPRRVSRAGRLVLALYAVLAVAISMWAMREAAIGWTLVAASTLAPAVVVAIVFRRHVRPRRIDRSHA